MKSITVHADVAGRVWKIAVAVGDTVEAEQDLLILDSMKMESLHRRRKAAWCAKSWSSRARPSPKARDC